MSGGDKYIIRNDRTLRVRGEHDDKVELPAPEAIAQCEAIRAYLAEHFDYDDEAPLAETVIALLAPMLPRGSEVASNGNGEVKSNGAHP